MTDAQYAKLVADFQAGMLRGETTQRDLAEIAWVASEKYGGVRKFADATGYKENTISRYKIAYEYSQSLGSDTDLTFADIMVLSAMSPERADAISILADLDGKSVSTVKSNTAGINSLRTFMADNTELVTEALKDEDTRKAVIGSAFAAASEGVVAEATRHTKAAADTKEKPRRFIAQEELKALEYKAINSGIWGKTNLPMIAEQMEILDKYMDTDHIEKMMADLYPAKVAMDELWAALEAKLANVTV